MNRKMVFRTVGAIVLLEAALLLLPLITSLIYQDPSALSFLITIGIALAVGGILFFFSHSESKVIFAKEGFAITALAWFFLSAIGALPFYLSGQIPKYIDAFFETVSGFTTTGASILTGDALLGLDRGTLFWRSFTHWVGGMGVLVFLMVFLPNVTDRSIHIIRAEMPGPTMGKIQPKLRDTAKILYVIYLVMTFVQVALLCLGDMPLFDSLLYSFGTAGTGGFGRYPDSAASLSDYQIWVITVFMLLFGINFNLYYLILIRRFRSAIRSEELWGYVGIVLVSIGLIALNLRGVYTDASELLKHSAFQVSSVITTTGFSTVDFNAWPALSKGILLMLMFIGGCAGSTAGGLKVSRIVLFFKCCHAEFRHMLHPRSVNVLRMDGKKVEKETQRGVTVYFALYMICFFAIFLAIALNGFDFESTFTAVATCINNVGPAFGLSGPAGSFAPFSDFSTVVLSFTMLLGRLEIWPIILTLCPTVWNSRKTK